MKKIISGVLPEILSNPSALYIIPTALPAAGKTTFLRLYASYMKTQGYETEIISRDSVILQLMDQVNQENKGRPGYPLSYADMHPENHRDGEGVIVDAPRYRASHQAMTQVLSVLAEEERGARKKLEKGGRIIIIHDDLNLTYEGRQQLLSGERIGTIDRNLGETEGNVVSIGFAVKSKIASVIFPVASKEREDMQSMRVTKGGGHKVPDQVITILERLYQPPQDGEPMIDAIINNPKGETDLTSVMAGLIGFSGAKELAEFLTVKEVELTEHFVKKFGNIEIAGNRQACYDLKDQVLDEFVSKMLLPENKALDDKGKSDLYNEILESKLNTKGVEHPSAKAMTGLIPQKSSQL